MTDYEKIVEIGQQSIKGLTAAECDPVGCQHSFNDRPCPTQYINRIKLILDWQGTVYDLPWNKKK
jgi:hypothetical protein